MNFCTKCGSMYSKPGTCNCYAEASPPAGIRPFYPWDTGPNWTPWYPYTPTYPYPWDVPNPTITWGASSSDTAILDESVPYTLT